MCLVLAEGIALKAPKIQRYTRNLDEVDWPWLQDLIDGNYYEDDGEESHAADDESGEADEGADEESAETDANDRTTAATTLPATMPRGRRASRPPRSSSGT